jgi:RNA polymerase sigma factor (sigma-70 family)
MEVGMNSNMTMTQNTEGDYNFYSLLYEVLTGRKPIDVLFEHDEFQRRGKQICYMVTRKWEDVEDLFQDSCLRVWKYGHRALTPENIRNEGEFFAWFNVVARNTHKSNWRKRRVLSEAKPLDEIFMADPQVNIEAQCFLSEFVEFTKTLSAERRQAIEYWLENYSYREIARNLTRADTTYSHVAVRAWIKEALKRFFDKKCVPVRKASGY